MAVRDDRLASIEHDLRLALGLELFVMFGFVVGILAYNGAFNGGEPTNTPTFAIAYTVLSIFVTVVVIARTLSMWRTARRGDVEGLRRVHVMAWTVVALVFSAILPAGYLYAVALDKRSL